MASLFDPQQDDNQNQQDTLIADYLNNPPPKRPAAPAPAATTTYNEEQDLPPIQAPPAQDNDGWSNDPELLAKLNGQTAAQPASTATPPAAQDNNGWSNDPELLAKLNGQTAALPTTTATPPPQTTPRVPYSWPLLPKNAPQGMVPPAEDSWLEGIGKGIESIPGHILQGLGGIVQHAPGSVGDYGKSMSALGQENLQTSAVNAPDDSWKSVVSNTIGGAGTIGAGIAGTAAAAAAGAPATIVGATGMAIWGLLAYGEEYSQTHKEAPSILSGFINALMSKVPVANKAFALPLRAAANSAIMAGVGAIDPIIKSAYNRYIEGKPVDWKTLGHQVKIAAMGGLVMGAGSTVAHGLTEGKAETPAEKPFETNLPPDAVSDLQAGLDKMNALDNEYGAQQGSESQGGQADGTAEQAPPMQNQGNDVPVSAPLSLDDKIRLLSDNGYTQDDIDKMNHKDFNDKVQEVQNFEAMKQGAQPIDNTVTQRDHAEGDQIEGNQAEMDTLQTPEGKAEAEASPESYAALKGLGYPDAEIAVDSANNAQTEPDNTQVRQPSAAEMAITKLTDAQFMDWKSEFDVPKEMSKEEVIAQLRHQEDQDKIREAAPKVEAPQRPLQEKPVVKTPELIGKLKDLGYTDDEINKLTNIEAVWNAHYKYPPVRPKSNALEPSGTGVEPQEGQRQPYAGEDVSTATSEGQTPDKRKQLEALGVKLQPPLTTEAMQKQIDILKGKGKPEEGNSSAYPDEVDFVTKDDTGQRITEILSYKDAIDRLIDAANTKKTSFNRVRYGEIPDSQANQARESAKKQNVDLEVGGFKRVIDSDDVRHIIKDHGDPVKEKMRGQVPITNNDILRIPEIVSNPDKVEYGGITKRKNLKMIRYTKRINGEIYYYEEVRTGERELAARSLYKIPSRTKEGSRGDAFPQNEGSSATSETTPELPSHDSTIPQKTDTGQENTGQFALRQGADADARASENPARPVDLDQTYRDILDNLKKTLGPLVKLEAYEESRPPGITEDVLREGMAKHGSAGNPDEYPPIRGMYTHELGEDGKWYHVIKLATAEDMADISNHEAFHGIQKILELTGRQKDMQILNLAYGGNPERMAEAYRDYAAGKQEPKNMARRIFDRVTDFLEKLKNYLGARGFRSASDIFGEAYAGKLAETADRAGELGSPSFSLNPLKNEAVEDRLSGVGKLIDVDAWKGHLDELMAMGRELKTIFAPANVSEEARRVAGSLRERNAVMDRKKDIAVLATQKMSKMFDEQTKDYNYKFLDDMELGKKQPTEDLQKIADTYKKFLDDRFERVNRLDPDAHLNYMKNYFPHLYKDPAKAAKIIDEFMAKGRLEGDKSFLKLRKIPTLKFARELGLEMVSDNPNDMFLQRCFSMDKYIMAHEFMNEMKSKGLFQFIGAMERVPSDLKAVGDPLGEVWRVDESEGALKGQLIRVGSYYGPKDAVRVLNNYLTPGLRGSKIFSAYLSAGNILNQAQLGLSFFHAGAETINSVLNQFALGLEKIAGKGTLTEGLTDMASALKAPFEDYAKGGELLEALDNPKRNVPDRAEVKELSKALKMGKWSGKDINQGHPETPETAAADVPAFDISEVSASVDKAKELLSPAISGEIQDIVKSLIVGGGAARQDILYQTQMTKKYQKAKIEGKTGKVLLTSPFALIEQLSSPIFEKLVPRLKLGAFYKLAEMELKRNPQLMEDGSREQLRDLMGKAWDSIDNRMGQVRYDNIFWNKVLKDLMMASVRSVGWTGGTIRELGGGLIDAGKAVNSLRKGGLSAFTPDMVTHRMAYTASLVVVTGIMGAVTQFLMTGGKGPDGITDLYYPKTGNLDEYGNAERISFPTYMKDIVSYGKHPFTTITNKVHPLMSVISDMLNNKDFYGHKVYNEGDPLTRQAIDIAKHTALALEPFASRGIRQNWKQNFGHLDVKALLPIVGITPAPAAISKTAAQTAMDEERAGKAPAGGRNTNEQARVDMKLQIERLLKKDPAAGQQLLKENLSKFSPREVTNIEMSRGISPYRAAFQRLPIEEALKVYELGTKKEKEEYLPLLGKKLQSLVLLSADKRASVIEKLKELGLMR